MAHVRLLGDPEYLFFYNVDRAVGPNCPNRRDDVLLVQFFLRQASRDSSRFRPSGGQIAVDGVCGPVTARWIRQFQDQTHARGNAIATDGRVDRVPEAARGRFSGAQYAIIWLNNSFRAQRPREFNDLPYLPECPNELYRALLHL